MKRILLVLIFVLSAVLGLVFLNDAQQFTLEQISNDLTGRYTEVLVFGYLMAAMALVSGAGLALMGKE